MTDEILQEYLMSLEEALWQRRTRFDPHYMDGILHPDFFEFGRSGRTYERSQMVDVGQPQDINATFPLQDFALHRIDDNSVLVTYVSEVEYEGVIERANRSSIWHYDTRWRLRFHQGTPTP